MNVSRGLLEGGESIPGERALHTPGERVKVAGGPKDVDGRWMAALIICAWALFMYVSIHTREPRGAWAWFGVTSMGSHFADLYPFPAALETLDASEDIYQPMAAEPWNRSYNYPVLWLTFMRYSYSDIPMLGSALAAVWLFVMLNVFGRLDGRQGLCLGILACSPPVILALERANTDLAVFCIVCLALVLLRRGQERWSWMSLTLAAVLKLYPSFAFASFLRLGKRRAWPWLVAAAVAVGVAVALQYKEIIGIVRETPNGGLLSYGATIWVRVANFWFARPTGTSDAFSAFLWPSTVCALLLAVTMFVVGARRSRMQWGDLNGAPVDGFRAGSGVFLGTFVLGGNFDYRLIFLLLCVPWLADRRPTGDRVVDRVRLFALVATVASMWPNPFWNPSLYYLRELARWVLMPMIAWLLGYTIPLGEPRLNGLRNTSAGQACVVPVGSFGTSSSESADGHPSSHDASGMR